MCLPYSRMVRLSKMYYQLDCINVNRIAPYALVRYCVVSVCAATVHVCVIVALAPIVVVSLHRRRQVKECHFPVEVSEAMSKNSLQEFSMELLTRRPKHDTVADRYK